MTRNQLWRADHWPLWAPTVASAGGCQPSSKSNLYRNGRTNMYNVNIKVHRVPKKYFRRFVYCKNARDVRTHLKMFVHSMSKRKPMHFNQISPKFRNLQSFLIELQEGTFLKFFIQHLLLAVLYERMASVLVAPTRNLPPNKPFSSKMILQVANFYQSSLQAPMGRCKSCWATIQAHKCVFILLPINPHNIHQIKINYLVPHQNQQPWRPR